MRFLLILFIAVPIIEMWLLIRVGSNIGPLPTIGLVLATAVIGMALLKQQGYAALNRAREKSRHGQLPLSEMVEGVFFAVSGALLLTPGFFTDTVGFLCLIPVLRQHIIGAALARFGQNFTFFGSNHYHSPFDQASNNTYEGSFSREQTDNDKLNKH